MLWGALWGEWHLDVGVLLLAVALDLALPEPPNALHPVVWMGRLISLLERLGRNRGRITSFLIGLCIALVVPAVFGGLVWLAVLGLHQIGDLAYLIGGAVLLKTTFALRGLGRAAQTTQRLLESADAATARHSLSSLVSRDATALTEPMVAAAAIESVAENTTDSVIAPWFAFALLGLPGAFVYRSLNTLDSMLGYRGKYEYLGKASARLDDFANFIPARICALLLLAGAGIVGLRRRTRRKSAAHMDEPHVHSERLSVRQGWYVMRREHGKTASPNAGWTIGAMAGALGVALEKPCHYRIGDRLPDPSAAHIDASVRVIYAAAGLGLAVSAALIALRSLIT